MTWENTNQVEFWQKCIFMKKYAEEFNLSLSYLFSSDLRPKYFYLKNQNGQFFIIIIINKYDPDMVSWNRGHMEEV